MAKPAAIINEPKYRRIACVGIRTADGELLVFLNVSGSEAAEEEAGQHD